MHILESSENYVKNIFCYLPKVKLPTKFEKWANSLEVNIQYEQVVVNYSLAMIQALNQVCDDPSWYIVPFLELCSVREITNVLHFFINCSFLQKQIFLILQLIYRTHT